MGEPASKAQVRAEAVRYLQDDRGGEWVPICDVVAHLRWWSDGVGAKAVLQDLRAVENVERRYLDPRPHPTTGRTYYAEIRVVPS